MYSMRLQKNDTWNRPAEILQEGVSLSNWHRENVTEERIDHIRTARPKKGRFLGGFQEPPVPQAFGRNCGRSFHPPVAIVCRREHGGPSTHNKSPRASLLHASYLSQYAPHPCLTRHTFVHIRASAPDQ